MHSPDPRSPCIVFAGGGTGGHLFPGIAVAQALAARNPTWRIVFVGTARGIEVRAVPRYGFELCLLPVVALRGRGAQGLLRGLAHLPQAGTAALRLVRALRPQVAVGVGGYAAGPAMVAARVLGARCLVMEQNAHAGYTNRALRYIAHHICLALPNAQLGGHPSAHLVGNPVRADLLPLRSMHRDRPEAFGPKRPLRLLVMGGSQGAHGINRAVLELLPMLVRQGLPLHIRHQTGTADHSDVAQGYAACNLPTSWAQPFIDDMAQAYAEADLVLCRSGASTLAELGVVGLPSVLVPYPSAADDHQTANAQVMVDVNAAVLLPQSACTGASLLALLEPWLANPAPLWEMAARAFGQGRPDAASRIVALIEAEVNRVQR